MEYSTETEIASNAVSAVPPSVVNWDWRSLRLAVSFPALMAVLLIAVALIGAEPRLIDPDTWWHVTVGEQILKTHTFPTADTYSFTARGAHWIAYEWLGDVFLALPARAAGLVGLAWFQKAMVVIFTLLLYFYAYLVSGNSKAACIASGIVLPIAPIAFTLRPQMFGFIFLLLTLICLQRFRQGSEKALWFLPPIFLLWANTHGTFMFGFLLIGIYWITGFVNFRAGGLTAERLPVPQRVKLLLVGLLCMFAILVTPYGSQIATNPLEIATAQPMMVANIEEWRPLSLADPLGKYVLLLALVLFLAQVILNLTYKLDEMVLLLFAMYSACAHVRFAMILVLFVAPIMAGILARWIPPYDPTKDKYLLNATIIALVVLAIIKFHPSKRSLEAAVASEYPVHAVEYLRAHPQPVGIFNEYTWGGYLISQLGAAQPVFIDGRADMYVYSGVFPDFMVATSGQALAMHILARHDIRSCLLSRTSALAALLAQSPKWEQVYSDDLSVIYVRSKERGAS
jgi:hypothetical protein